MNRDLKNLWNLKDLKDLISEDDIKQYNRFQRILRTTKDRRIYNILYRKLILVEKGRTNKNILKGKNYHITFKNEVGKSIDQINAKMLSSEELIMAIKQSLKRELNQYDR